MARSDTNSRPRKMDIRTVAAKAGVSIATVSRTINRVSSVNPKIARRVWKAVEDLDYFPNTQARALVSGRSRLLGLIVSEITNPFFPELIKSFEDAAVERGYEILIGSTNYDPKRMALCVRRMLERNVEGVAIMTFGIEEPLLDQLSTRNVPMVFVDLRPEKPFVTALVVDYQRGIREAVQHLAVMGHRDIAFISGPLHVHSAHARQEAFCNSMKEIGVRVPAMRLVEGNHTAEGGFDAMQKLLAQRKLASAVMCSNDMTAIGVLRALNEQGLRVTQDIYVVGFDDIHMAQYTSPALTTIRMSCSELAHNAVDALLTHAHGTTETPLPVTRDISTNLVVRRTTGYPRTTPPVTAKSAAGSRKK